jgi:hypothetical protein
MRSLRIKQEGINCQNLSTIENSREKMKNNSNRKPPALLVYEGKMPSHWIDE